MSEVSSEISEAVALLKEGEVVVFPTETVYGLGADASNSDAVARVFQIKGRPSGHPLIVHVADIAQAKLWVNNMAEPARKLADRFWPGPLTMVLPRNDKAASEVTGGLGTIALRVPSHPVALELLSKFDGGLAGPSANKFGRVSPTTAAHAKADLGDEVAMVVDGGRSDIGVESTIVDMSSATPTILRHGGVEASAIAEVLGKEEIADDSSGKPRASGMLKSHYAPLAKVKLTTVDYITTDDFALESSSGLITHVPVEGSSVWTLPNDARAYGKNLYSLMREADERGLTELLVVPPTDGELLDALLDRLAKASAPRPGV